MTNAIIYKTFRLNMIKKDYNFDKSIYSWIKVWCSGYTLKDKIILSLCFFNPIRIKMVLNNRPYSLPSNVLIKNKDGIFYCANGWKNAHVVNTEFEKKLRKYFNFKKGVFIDIGAHIGKYTIMMGRKLKSKGKVVAIEPDPSHFEMLKKNIQLNSLKNIFAVNTICSDKNGNVLFSPVNTSHPKYNYIVKDHEKKILVVSRKLDTLIDDLKINRVDFIKIDVDGSELLVLKGAKKILKKYHPLIIIEVSVDFQDIENLLKPYNYKIEKTDLEGHLYAK